MAVMVFAVQCPNPKCKKFMLVEDHQQGKVVPCLLCRTAIKIGVTPPALSPAASNPSAAKPVPPPGGKP
jgi:hypothetical protein